MNSFGEKFRLEIFGESHGPAVGIVLDGVPAGIHLEEDDFLEDIGRRSPASYPAGSTSRHEKDIPKIVSGVFEGTATGAPLCIIFDNADTDPDSDAEYARYVHIPRPGHADFTAAFKYGHHYDMRGGGQFSGRMTLPLVAAGVVAKKIISPMLPSASLLSIGGEDLSKCADEKSVSEAVSRAVGKATSEGDSIGGTVRCICDGVPAGLGEPFFDSVESEISHLVFSIPGARGIEFGAGFASAGMKGSQCNDPFTDGKGSTATNNCGGINGGITNGNRLSFDVAFKPPSSIAKVQRTFDFHTGKIEDFSVKGRHDVCFALRTPVIVEACCTCVLADLMLRNR